MENELNAKAVEFISSMGNAMHLQEHILYFERLLQKEIFPFLTLNILGPNTTEDAFTSSEASRNCHFFAAWIRLYTEFTCNKAMGIVSGSENQNTKIADLDFKAIIKEIKKIAKGVYAQKGISNDRFDEMIRCLRLVIELRHTFQHGGLPNVLRIKKIPSDINVHDLVGLIDPKRVKETKGVFDAANELINLIPKPTIRIRKGQLAEIAYK